MSNQEKRAYSSAVRDTKAKKTRKRILKAAEKLFVLKGFEYVTIEKIAKAAAVSAPTIYALFQSKRGVLLALMDAAFPAEEHRALVEEGMSKATGQERLELTAKLTRRLYDAECSQMDLLRGAALLSPEFKKLEHEREQRRYLRQEEFMTIMHAEKKLAEHLSLATARDILWAFTGRDMYRLFVVERGWSSDAYEQWLRELLQKTLLTM